MPLAFDRDFEPKHGEAIEVAPGVHRVTAANENPFTFRGTNTFLIGGTTLAILDPGPADPAHLETVTRAIGSASVAHILLTHSHHDHSAAVPLLKERTGAPVLAAGAHGSLADKQLRDGEIVETADYRLEVLATPGHASDHLAFALAGAGILFSGDHVMGWSTTIVAPPDGSMGDYMASLDRLLVRPERLYLPAHGGPIRDGPTYVRGLKAHRLMREAAILDGLWRGDKTVAELVARVYGGLDPSLTVAASLSTLAHLEYLVARGAVAADGPPALDRRYWLSDAASAASVPGSG